MLFGPLAKGGVCQHQKAHPTADIHLGRPRVKIDRSHNRSNHGACPAEFVLGADRCGF